MTKNNINKNLIKKYICNRCGRCNFTNGHALGGHKKYCKKPEYYNKSGKKRKKTWNKDFDMDLKDIINSINNIYMLDASISSKIEEIMFTEALTKVINHEDLNEILIIRSFLKINNKYLENTIKNI
jgi:hypothetical protein